MDVQADLLDGFNTRVFVPLFPIDEAPKPAQRLNPLFEIDGMQVVMLTQFLVSVPASILNDPAVCLVEDFAVITNTLDMVFQGY
jgi:toxin CcdB